MIKTYIINLIGKNRSLKYNIHLGLLLTFIAGGINAGGFLYIGQYTSNMTGIASSIADFLVLKNFHLASLALIFLFSFIIGAATTSILVNWIRSKNLHGEFAVPLMIEALLILVFSLFIINDSFIKNSKEIIITMLCFVMGLQNAIITKISNARIRTTHITGLVTDIGIQLGRLIFKFLGHNKLIKIEYGEIKLFSSLLLFFCLGGIFGALMFKYFGFLATIPFSLLLIFIALIAIIHE